MMWSNELECEYLNYKEINRKKLLNLEDLINELFRENIIEKEDLDCIWEGAVIRAENENKNLTDQLIS